MIRPILVLSLVCLALVGCKGSREKEVIGSWTGGSTTLVAAEDKTFKSNTGPVSLEGTWTVDKDDVTFTPKTVNGKAIAEIKAALQQKSASLPAQAKSFLEDLDKPNVMLLNSDGKSMTTDKAKDTNSGPAATFTKSSS